MFRPNLVDRLSNAEQSKIILVGAPAGYGKSSLLNQFVSQSNSRFTWYSLDDTDNSSQIFWTYFIHGLKGIDPKIGKKSLALIRSG